MSGAAKAERETKAGALLGVGARALPNAVVERSADLIAALSNK